MTNYFTDENILFVNGSLKSKVFNDIYFSAHDSIGESNYNFLKGNNLNYRFKNFTPTLFTITETGFGSGLNFLLTAQLWSNSAAKNKKLNYISVEKHPINKKLLLKIYQEKGWVNAISEQLLNKYQPNKSIQNIMIDSNIKLTILYGDALDCFLNYNFVSDAWFLDGFAPSKNPDMWSKELIRSIADHSKKGSTFATFTAASKIRRNLENFGFFVQKEKGFARKRERLIGYFL